MTIHWGLVGCGDIAQKRVAAGILADENSKLIGACRRTESLLHEFGKRYEIPFLTTSPEALFAHDEIDAVYIATPVHRHCSQTVAAAAAGKHVLVEKPMAYDVAECNRMVAACRSANVLLGVAYYRRFYPIVARLKQLIDSGSLGRPLSILATTGNENRFPPDDWRVVKALGGGGPLMDIGSHRLDLFLHLFGSVKGVLGSNKPSPDFEAEEMASVVIEFENGVHGMLQCYFGTVNAPDRLEVIGTDGRATAEDLNQGELTIITAQGTSVEHHPPHENFHAPLISDFSDAILNDRPPEIPGEIGLITNRIIGMAY